MISTFWDAQLCISSVTFYFFFISMTLALTATDKSCRLKLKLFKMWKHELPFHWPWTCADWNCEQKIRLMETGQFWKEKKEKSPIYRKMFLCLHVVVFWAIHKGMLTGRTIHLSVGSGTPGARCTRNHKRLHNSSEVEQVILKFGIRSSSVKSSTVTF